MTTSGARLPGPGELVGPYRVEALLGRGGMGGVLRAVDPAGRAVALKVLLPGATTARRVQRLAREGAVLARLGQHPGVVRVHASGEDRGLHYVVMELIDGPDLERHLATAGPLPVGEVLALGASLARTLEACHAAGVLHRDLKPANVLVAPRGPVVADFGLASDGGSDERLTRTGEVLGTPACMAPEQLEGRCDARTDVYALAAILYQALTGRAVVVAGSLEALVYQVVDVDPPPPRSLRPDCPPDLDAVLRASLQKDPGRRHPTAAALADDLERVARGEPPAFARRPRGGRLSLALALLAALAAPAGLAAAVPLRRARGALADHAAWEARALDPWALGAGAGPAPAQEELAARRAALIAARPRLSRALQEGFDAALERLDDHARLLARDAASARRPARSAGGLVVDALLLEATDPRLAAERADQALAREPASAAAAAVRARLWAARLAAAPDRTTGAQLRSWLDAPERSPAASAAARAAAVEGLAEGYAGLVRRAPGAASPRPALEEAAGLGPLLALDPAALEAAVGSRKRAALEASAPAWEAPLRAAREPRDLEQLLTRLGDVARAAPAVELGPALGALADRVVGAPLPGDERDPGRRRLRTLALDQRLLDAVDPSRPPAAALVDAVQALVFANQTDPAVALAGLRVGEAAARDAPASAPFLAGDELLDLRAELKKIGAAALADLLRRRPTSRAARLGLAVLQPPADAAALAAALEPVALGGANDLAPFYQARLWQMLAAQRGLLVEPAPPGPARRAAMERVVEAARRVRTFELAERSALEDAFRQESGALSLAAPGETQEPLWAESIALFRGRLARTEAATRPEDQRRYLEALSLARSLVNGAVAVAERRRAWSEEGLALAARVEVGPQQVRDLRLQLSLALRLDGRPDQAEAALAPLLAAGLGDALVAAEAATVSATRGRQDEARDRVRAGLAANPGHEPLRRLARTLGVEAP